MISVGQKMRTDFRVKWVAQGLSKETQFSELLTRPTIVSVYMRNNTSSCDKQNDSLLEGATALERRGFNVLALSRDTCGSHAKYAAKKNIGYTLISDPDDRFSKAADSIIPKSMYGKKYLGPARAAFVIDTDGTVLGIIEKIDSANHLQELEHLLSTIAK